MLGHSPGKKNANFGDPYAGQTLLSYLKRKNKGALNTLLASQKIPESTDQKSIQEQMPTYSTRRKQQRRHESDLQFPNAMTPDRLTYQRDRHRSSKDSLNVSIDRKSFISIISPIKNNNVSGQKRKSILVNRQSSKQSFSYQSYSKRMLNKQLASMQQTFHGFMGTGKKLKEKTHCLFIQIKPLLEQVQEIAHSNPSLKRKTADIKERLRLFQHQFKAFEVPDCHQIIEKFNILFREHMDSLEAQLRQQYQRTMIETVSKIKTQKNLQIDELRDSLETQSKHLEIANRKLQKLQNALQNAREQKEAQENSLSGALTDRISNFENKLNQEQEKNKRIQSELEKQIENNRILQKELKSVRYLKDESERKFEEEKKDIVSSKEQYLLNEIMMLKEEFQRDLEQITHCDRIKQTEQARQRAMLQKQLELLKLQITSLRALREEADAQYRLIRGDNSDLRRQNECLITDLHRMNEQLYQHWLALKDVKSLAQRLQIFGSFARIFSDLVYNDRLFQ